MRTILFISHEWETMLGASQSLYNLIHSLPKDYRCFLVLPKKGAVCDFFSERGVRCLIVPFHVDFCGSGNGYGWKYFLTAPFRIVRDFVDNRRAASRIVKMLSGEKVDIVHSNTSAVDIGPYLARKLHAQHVWHLREFLDLDMNFHPVGGWKRLKRKIRHSDAIISITNVVARHFDVADLPQTNILFDAVRGEKDVVVNPHKEKYFVFCGHIKPAKGPDVAIRAFSLFHKRHPDYKLMFLGNVQPNYLQYLRSLVDERTLADVSFEGYTSNVAPIVSRATALLMCSSNEAQGRVTVEAMLMSCPVIALDAGGTREIVRDGETGWMFHSAEECCAAMEDVVGNPQKATAMATRALAFAKDNFLEETYGAKIHRVYSQILKDSPIERRNHS